MRVSAVTGLRVFLVFIVLLAPSFAQASPQNVILRFRYWGDVKEIAALSKTIAEFDRAHPGVTVIGERVPSGSEYMQKVLVEQTAGLTPDVMFLSDFYPSLASHGVLMNLTPLVKSDPSLHLSDYFPEVTKIFTLDGKLYGLPRDIAPEGLVYYNKSLFRKANIPYPNGDWAWDYVSHPDRGNKDFLNVVKKLTNVSSNPTKTVFGFAATSPDELLDLLVYSSGGEYVDNVFHPTKFLFNDPRVIKALQLSQDLSYKYNFSPTQFDLHGGTEDTHDLFAQGRIAMYVCGVWEVPRFRTEITKFDWDIAPFPAGPTGIHGCGAGWSGYGISAKTKHKQLAWEFVKFLTGPVGMGFLAHAGVAMPARSRLADSPMWLNNGKPKNLKLTFEEVPWVHFNSINPAWTQIYNRTILPAEELVWNGSLTAKQAVSQFLPDAQKQLDRLNHPQPHPNLDWWAALAGMLCVCLGIVAWVWDGVRRDVATRRSIGERSEVRAGWMFISPWIIGAIIFVLTPMLVSLVLAFSQWDMLSPAKWVGVGNFQEMAQDPLFWKSLEVTIIFTLFAVPLAVGGSLGLALLLNTKIKGQSIFRTLYYIPSIASSVAASLIWMKVFDPESGPLNTVLAWLHFNPFLKWLGLTDPVKGYVNWLGSEHTALASMIVMSLWGVGGGMVIFLAGLQGIPQSYYDAADVDGANVWQKFRHVTIPLLTPTIFFSLIMGFIGSFQVFTQGFVMTQGGPNNATLFYVLYLYQNAFQYLKMGYASALAWILFIIIMAVTILQMRTSKWVYYGGAETK